MPVFKDDMMEQPIAGTNYGFSATRLENLGATEYTLGTIVVDVSGSTIPFRDNMEKALKAAVESCKSNPRADNMMLRVIMFDGKVEEFHGFKQLRDCSEADYDGCLGRSGGVTALYDATYNAIQSVNQYAETLVKQDYDVNAIVFVITDGMDYGSTGTRKMVGEAFKDSVTSESLESMNSVLIGVNAQDVGTYLTDFKDESGFTQYVGLDDANPNTLAKLGDFISKSLSSTSQALGTGGPSQSLAF